MIIDGKKDSIGDRNTCKRSVSEKPENYENNNNCDNHTLLCFNIFWRYWINKIQEIDKSPSNTEIYGSGNYC